LTAPGTDDWTTDMPRYGVRTSIGNGAVCVDRAQVRVRSVLYDAAGEIDVLAADVVGWCGTATVPSLVAGLRRNSTAEYAALTDAPSVLDRLHTAVGTPTAAQTVTVRNTGTLPVTTGAVEVRGDGGAPVRSYRMRRAAAGSAAVVVADVPRVGDTAPTYLDRGLVSDAEYTYTVAAVTVTAAGGGPESAAVTVRIPSAELVQNDEHLR
jgi:hypothetical protein